MTGNKYVTIIKQNNNRNRNIHISYLKNFHMMSLWAPHQLLESFYIGVKGIIFLSHHIVL